MMKWIPAIAAFSFQWQARVAMLLASPPATADPLRLMGLPPNWERHAVWQ